MSDNRTSDNRLASLFERLRPRLLAAGRRLTGNSDDAADAVQDTFVKLWRSATEANEGTVITAMRNMCIDRLRRNRPDTALDEADRMADTLAADTDPPDSTLYDEVDRLIRTTLTERDRDILLMRDRDGFELDAIAARTGLSEANIRVILSRSRRAVRQTYRNLHQSTNSNQPHSPS